MKFILHTILIWVILINDMFFYRLTVQQLLQYIKNANSIKKITSHKIQVINR